MAGRRRSDDEDDDYQRSRDKPRRERVQERYRSRSNSPRNRRSRPSSRERERRGHSDRDSGARSDQNTRRRYRSRSRDCRRSRSRSPARDGRVSLRRDSHESSALQRHEGEQLPPPEEKQRPNFGVSGRLAAETNTVSGTDIVLKYNEPPEARKPPASQAWRMYVFKGKETVDEVELHKRSCWLFGRERIIADHDLQHPSISKQHAVVQFRHIETKNEFGDRIGSVKPYLIDLDSSNGTRVNGKAVPPSRFYELRSGDVVIFGDSTREYVMMLPPKG